MLRGLTGLFANHASAFARLLTITDWGINRKHSQMPTGTIIKSSR